MAVLSNKVTLRSNEGSAVIHYTANATVVIAGNNGVSGISSAGEVVESAKISQIWFGVGVANSFWTVTSGNTVHAVVSQTGHLNFAAGGTLLTLEPNESLVLALNNAADDQGFIMIELKKKSVAE